MNSTNLYLRMNNYFKTDLQIDEVIDYLQNPKSENNLKKNKRFIEKCKNFKVKNNTLFYNPLNLEVIRHSALDDILKKEYELTPAIGITNFYKTIRMKYLNIKRSDVEEFIKSNVNHQLMGDITHRTNKPIISTYTNQLWALDLIDLSSYKSTNNRFKYILNVIDVFSRRIWLQGMKKKTSKALIDTFKIILNKAKVNPSYLISDNGGEFKNKEFLDFCNEKDIKLRFNRAYSPQSNGIIERSNKEVEKLIHSYFILNHNTNWINSLNLIENNKNNTYTKAIKNKPINVWDNSKNIVVEQDIPEPNNNNIITKNEQKIQAKNVIIKNVKEKIEEFKDSELEEGDRVRIRLDAIANNIKKLIKQGHKKKIIITYTPLVFTIIKKIIPRKTLLERCLYICAFQDRILLNKFGGQPRKLYSNVLMKVPKDTPDTIDNMTIEKAIKLSGENPTSNDAVIEDI